MEPHSKVVWLLLAAVALAYLPAAWAGFFWDDHALLFLHPPSSLAAIWSGDLWEEVGSSTPYYRPVAQSLLWLDLQLWGDQPGPYHIHNLLWHLLSCALVYVLASPRIGAARALVAAAIFGLHPIQSEAVLWISARFDLMATALILTTLIAVERGRWWLAGVGALCASLCKESAIFLPIYLVLWRFAFAEARVAGPGLLSVGAGVGLSLVLRQLAALPSISLLNQELLHLRLAEIAVTYLGWLALPWPLTSASSLYRLPGALAWVGAVGAILGGWLLARRAPARILPLYGWGLLAFAPALLVVGVTGLLGERFLYLALVPVAVAVAAAAPARLRLPGFVAGGAAILLIFLRARAWSTEEGLLREAIARTDDPYAWFRLGIVLQQAEPPAPDARREAFGAFMHALQGPRPVLPGCPHPIAALLEVGATPQAAELAQQLQPICAGNPDFVRLSGLTSAP